MDCDHDARLYITQVLMVTASSPLVWSSFHIVGYSFGGGVAISFARYFPQRLLSLASIAGGGLIRSYHVSWKSRLLYNSGMLPEWLVRVIARRRIRPAATIASAVTSSAVGSGSAPAAGGSDLLAAESQKVQSVNKDGDARGGGSFEVAPISKSRPGVTVSAVMTWQIDHHQGFLPTFLSSIRNGPIYAPQEDWAALAPILRHRREARALELNEASAGLRKGKILLILGREDSVVVHDEAIEDAQSTLGIDAVEYAVLEGGHEIPFVLSVEVAGALQRYWSS
jgi:pimeloyl-ACP methyl ester carboxylesterase